MSLYSIEWTHGDGMDQHQEFADLTVAQANDIRILLDERKAVDGIVYEIAHTSSFEELTLTIEEDLPTEEGIVKQGGPMIDGVLTATNDETIEAVRRATDPFGMDGDQTAARRRTPTDIVDRLREQGFRVVREEDTVGWLSGSDCGYVASTAAEGGIGYWSQIDRYDHKRWSPDSLNESYVDGDAPSSNIDVPDDFVFYTIRPDLDDSGSYEGDPVDITPELLRRGVGLVLRGVPDNFEARAFRDMKELEAMDADEADWVVQLGAFGELRYG